MIFPTHPFVSLVGDQITVGSNDPADAGGPYTVIIMAKLQNYPLSSAFAPLDIYLNCEVMSLALSTTPPPPTIYTHVLQYDPIPASIPYQVTQSPLCGAALTYSFLDATGTTAPSWIYDVPGSNLELIPSNIALVGSYNFILTATEAVSGTSSSSAIQVDLNTVISVNPCSTSTVIASEIADTILHLKTKSPGALSSSIPFSDFTTDVTASSGLDCGAFSYSVTLVNLIP